MRDGLVTVASVTVPVVQVLSESEDQLVELVRMTEYVEEIGTTREDVEGVADGIEVIFGEMLEDAQGLGSVLGGLLVLVVVGVVLTSQLFKDEGGLVKKLVCGCDVEIEVDVHGSKCGVGDERWI